VDVGTWNVKKFGCGRAKSFGRSISYIEIETTAGKGKVVVHFTRL